MTTSTDNNPTGELPVTEAQSHPLEDQPYSPQVQSDPPANLAQSPEKQSDLPKIQPHPTDYHGHFILDLPETLRFSLAGIETNGAETLVRLGVLPHNQSICQKLIQTFGHRTLNLLRQQDPDRPRQAANHWCQTEVDEAELYSLWQFIDILSLIKPLEQVVMASDTANGRKTIDAVIAQLDKKKKELSCYSAFNCTQQEKALVNRLNDIHTRLLNLAETQAKTLKNKLDHNPIDRQQCFHHLLHTLLNEFENQQTAIGVAQRGVFNWLALANGTNTLATQAAYYELQDHLYSAYGCTAEQQWQQAQSAKNTQLDTTTFPSLRQQDALYAACLVHANAEINTVSKADVLRNAANETLKNAEKIKDAHIEKKCEIDQVRSANVNGWHHPWQWLCAHLGWFRDQSMQQAFASAPLTAGSYSWWQVPFSKVLSQAIVVTPSTNDTDENPVHSELRKTYAGWKTQLPQQTDKKPLVAVMPANVYCPSDLYSAITSFGSEFSQYFNRELASKHPTLTTLAFIVPSIYGTAFTLEAVRLMPHAAQSLYTLLSKIMSINGLLVDPNSLNTAASHVNHAWLEITGAESIAEKIILNGLGLPKITAFAADIIMPKIIGNTQTIIANLKDQFGDNRIDTNNIPDEIREQLKSLGMNVMLISTALALGAIAPSMASYGPLMAAIGEFISFFDHVDGGVLVHAFDSPMNATGTVVQMKTSALFLAKFYTIQHLATKRNFSKLPATLDFFRDHRTDFKSQPEYPTHREVLERAVAEDPMLKAIIGIDQLNDFQIREYRPAPRWLMALWQFIKKVAGTINTVVIGALALLPSLGYMAVTPSHTVPKNHAAAYAFKQALKLCYGWLRGGPLFTILGMKFFAIALGGALLRLLVASVHALGMILVFPVNVIERLYQKGLTNTAGYLGVTLLSIVKIPFFVLESVCYILSLTALIPITASVCGLISYVKNERFKTIWRYYRQHHRPLSEMCEDVRQEFLKSNPDENVTQQCTAYVFRLCVAIAELGIDSKNWLGHGALWWRDHSLRRLEHRLQFVEKTLVENTNQAVMQPSTEASECNNAGTGHDTSPSPFSYPIDRETKVVASSGWWPRLFLRAPKDETLEPPPSPAPDHRPRC